MIAEQNPKFASPYSDDLERLKGKMLYLRRKRIDLGSSYTFALYDGDDRHGGFIYSRNGRHFIYLTADDRI